MKRLGKIEVLELSNRQKQFLYNYSKDDFEFNYKGNFRNRNIESRLTIQQGVKKFIEILVIILIIIDAVSKCNIISFILLILLVFTYSYDSLSTKVMFRIIFLLLFLLVVQYFIFVSNISYYTNPFSNIEVIIFIKERIKIPWSTSLGYRWSTFFSLGTNRYQIVTLWIDVIIILIL